MVNMVYVKEMSTFLYHTILQYAVSCHLNGVRWDWSYSSYSQIYAAAAAAALLPTVQLATS